MKLSAFKPDPDRERKQQMAHAMFELVRTDEWKVYEGMVLAMVDQRVQALMTAELENVQSIQGELRGMQLCLMLPQQKQAEAKG